MEEYTENPTYRGARRAAVHGLAEATQLSGQHNSTQKHPCSPEKSSAIAQIT